MYLRRLELTLPSPTSTYTGQSHKEIEMPNMTSPEASVSSSLPSTSGPSPCMLLR